MGGGKRPHHRTQARGNGYLKVKNVSRGGVIEFSVCPGHSGWINKAGLKERFGKDATHALNDYWDRKNRAEREELEREVANESSDL